MNISRHAYLFQVSIISFALFLTCGRAYANPNMLSGMGGLFVLQILMIIGLFLLAVLLVLGLWFGVKWARGNDPQRRNRGWLILAGIFLFLATLVIRFVDFNYYILEDNTFTDTAQLKVNYDNYYFEMEDGRIFFWNDLSQAHPNAGEPVVINYNGVRNSTQLYKIVEVSLSEIHDRKRYVDYKFVNIPLIPTRVDRYRLTNISLVTEMNPDWTYGDLLTNKAIRIIWCCNLDFVKLLIQRGGDPNRIVDGRRPVMHASRQLLFSSDDKSRKNLENILDAMLVAGLDVNHQDANGNTALHEAVRSIYKEQIYWLLENGADLSIRNHKNKTPIDVLRERVNRPNPMHMRREIKETLRLLENRQ